MKEPELLDTEAEPDVAPRWRGGKLLSDGHTLYWWGELLLVLVLDVVYESVRNFSKGKPSEAYANAVKIMDWQRALGINHEKAIQDWSLGSRPVIIASNYFYGSAYIAITILALVFLFRRFPDDYPLWRNTLAVGTLLGLVGFATFPLMPPRLLDVHLGHQVYGFVDTLVKYPTFWSFESPTMKSISNQFAAMPSLHCGWALWGFFLFWPRVRSWWAKALVTLYPITTVYVVVATANHYFLDAVGGAVIFLVGYVVARLFTRTGDERRAILAWQSRRGAGETGRAGEAVGVSTEDATTGSPSPRGLWKPL